MAGAQQAGDQDGKAKGEPEQVWPEVPLSKPPPPMPELLKKTVERPAWMRPQQASPLKPAMALASLGIELAVYICTAGAIGWWIDQKAGTGKTWTLVGLLLGIAGGGWRFLRAAKKASRG